MSSHSRSAPCVLHVSPTTTHCSSIKPSALTQPPPRSKMTNLATLEMRLVWIEPFGSVTLTYGTQGSEWE
eukprot:3177760-Prymnesium_polylepis.1